MREEIKNVPTIFVFSLTSFLWSALRTFKLPKKKETKQPIFWRVTLATHRGVCREHGLSRVRRDLEVRDEILSPGAHYTLPSKRPRAKKGAQRNPLVVASCASPPGGSCPF